MALSRRCGNGVYRHPERWIDRERERERDVYLHGQRCVIALPIEFSYTGMASLMHKMTGPNSVIVRFTKRIYARVVNIARRIPNQCDIVTTEFPSSSGARGGGGRRKGGETVIGRNEHLRGWRRRAPRWRENKVVRLLPSLHPVSELIFFLSPLRRNTASFSFFLSLFFFSSVHIRVVRRDREREREK